MEYVVQKGDTLYGIGRQFGISVSELMEKNHLNSTSLQIGQVLLIPMDSTNTYTVQKGDTLYSISKKYGIPVSELIELNQLTSQILSIGQVLNVGEEEVSSNTYIVKKGDTLYSIAKKVGVSVSNLISYNQLSSTTLRVGQELSLSPQNDIPLGSSCYGDVYQEPTYLTHMVKKGDTLYSLAKKYGVTVDQIVKLNNLSNTRLSIGQVLKIKEAS